MGHQDQIDGDGKFRTKDLPLAAFLCLKGFDHEGLEKRGRVAYWIYTRTPELDAVVRDYGDGEVCLNLKTFMDSVADVRSDLYSFLGVS
jgi:hypothetical protein